MICIFSDRYCVCIGDKHFTCLVAGIYSSAIFRVFSHIKVIKYNYCITYIKWEKGENDIFFYN